MQIFFSGWGLRPQTPIAFSSWGVLPPDPPPPVIQTLKFLRALLVRTLKKARKNNIDPSELNDG